MWDKHVRFVWRIVERSGKWGNEQPSEEFLNVNRVNFGGSAPLRYAVS